MSTALLDAVVKKNRARLIPFMLALYVLAVSRPFEYWFCQTDLPD